MNKKNYKWVVYFIGITVILTIAVQVYWNYREYQINKQNLISSVQLSLDNAVETYFVNLTKSAIITYKSVDSSNLKVRTDTIVLSTNSKRSLRKKMDSAIYKMAKLDGEKPILIKSKGDNFYPFVTANRAFPKSIDSLISKVFISISRDTLDLLKLNNYLTEEFKRNKIDVTYGLKYNYHFRHFNDSIVRKTIDYNLANFPQKHLKAISNSTYLPHRTKLELFFTNETAILLRDSMISILLSLLLSASIIGSLFYLLKTIYKQKQLADVKNDLISNITHEFKTPIATISTALEAMKNFNVLNDKVKSEKYVSIAHSQVEKLNVMVEKILETATLNQEELVLKKSTINLGDLIEEIVHKYSEVYTTKTFHFENNSGTIIISLDTFHFENAIRNILDNAIKYGGDLIHLELTTLKNSIIFTIQDNGIGIPKSQKDKVFEQFYRIPSGNKHDVKGFGIGLYYTKNIIEKHGGSININYDKNNQTLFKIKLLNER
jgi:two-component system phosphate regulon sensor histidine kinase PhoR